MGYGMLEESPELLHIRCADITKTSEELERDLDDLAQEFANKRGQQYDVVTKAAHYQDHPSGIEAINIVRCLNFDMGCAVKYVMRRHGKEYDRSLKSAMYYLKDQHVYGNQMILNYAVFRLLESYAVAETVPQAKAFYRAVIAYIGLPTTQHFGMVTNALTRLQEDRV